MDYKGEHQAPDKDSGAPLHNLSGIYPKDFYDSVSKASRYYGDEGGSAKDIESVSHMHSAKDRPNKSVKMYRAVPHVKSKAEKLAEHEKEMENYMRTGKVPKDSSLSGSAWYNYMHEEKKKLENQPETEQKPIKSINPGDWVTLNKRYATEHGHGALNGAFKIISKTVPAKHLYTDGNSVHEFGYDPTEK